MLNARNKMRILQNMINMKSWKNVENPDVYNLSQQEIFVNGRQGKFIDFTRNLPVIEINQMDKITNLMYISLGCKLSDTIKTLLKMLIKSIVDLREINIIVLKTISVLFNFIHIAPNIMSHEPGILTTSLSLNLQLAELIKENDIDLFERKIFQMINSVEQFLISNCSLQNINSFSLKETDDQSILYKINDLLDNVGLSTTYIIEFIPNDEISQIDSFNVINVQLVEKLKPLLLIPHELEATIKKLNKIENILIYMNYINNSITKILYEIIIQTLYLFEHYIKKGNKKYLQMLLDDWINNDDVLFEYQQLIRQAIFMKFPLHFINQIELLAKIIRDILVHNNILDLNIVKIQVYENLYALQHKEHPEKLLTMKNAGYNFNKYLNTLLSIDELKSFNEIFVLFQNNPAKYNSSEITLNTIEYDINDTTSTLICDMIVSLYNDCFYVQSKLFSSTFNTQSKQTVRDSPKKQNNLKELCLLILYKIQEIFNNYKNNLQEDMKFILKMAIDYLGNNMIYFPTNLDQLNRIIYYILVLFDKIQIHKCKKPQYRETLHISYNNNQYTVEELTNDFKNDKKSDEELIRQKINIYIEEFKNVYDVQSVKFYWKGELRTINEISNDLTENVFEFSSFTKFYNIFHQWNLLIVFDALDNILNDFLKENYVEYNDKKFITYIKQIQTISFPKYLLPPIKAIGSAENFNLPENTIGILILIQENTQQYISMIKSKYYSSEIIDKYLNNLNIVCNNLVNIYNINHENTKVKSIERQKTLLNRLKLNIKK